MDNMQVEKLKKLLKKKDFPIYMFMILIGLNLISRYFLFFSLGMVILALLIYLILVLSIFIQYKKLGLFKFIMFFLVSLIEISNIIIGYLDI